MQVFTNRHIFTKSGTIHNSSKLENTQMIINSGMDKLTVLWSQTAGKKILHSVV